MNLNKKHISISIILTLVLSLLLETYIILQENSSYFYLLSNTDGLLNLVNFFSIKQFIVFFAIFLILSYILTDSKLRTKFLYYLYNYRFVLGFILLAICVIFELHGSSLALLDISGVEHKPLLGIYRAIKGDEFSVSTPFALSQYFNDFSYFTEVLRATATDIFILYGQPVWDLAIIFRPFQIGYLLLPQAKGLSFYWFSRLIVLFLISFEFGMLLVNNNKKLALSYTLLLTFSPLVQWWFGVNFLVEMLIFGQLAILLINHYLLTDNYLHRTICALILVICSGGFIFALYPAWQVPLAYVFLMFLIWIIYTNKNTFKFDRIKDSSLILLFLILTVLLVSYVLFKSQDAIISQLHTVYPGLRTYLGGVDHYWLSGDGFLLFDYMRNIFYPLASEELGVKASLAYVISFFPMGILLYAYTTFVQKKKDLLNNLLVIVYVAFICYYLFTFPQFIADITLLSKSMTHRLLAIITFIGLLILFRSMTVMNRIDFKNHYQSLAISGILTAFVLVMAYIGMGSRFYTKLMIIISFIIFTASFYFILNFKNNEKYQRGFLICVILIAFSSGFFVNSIDSGTDYYFDQPVIKEVSSIVDKNPNATWVVEGHELYINEIIPVGAHTLNSVNTYPNYKLWSILDPNNNHEDVWNRYAHLKIVFTNQTPTVMEIPEQLGNTSDHVVLTLNVNDMEKLNISYILSKENLTVLSNDNVTFTDIYEDNGVFIYRVDYH